MQAGTQDIGAKPQKAALKVRESDVVNACMRWLYARGIFCWRNNSGAYKTEGGSYVRFGYPGSPDILGITPRGGRMIGIECKSNTGSLKDNQIAFGDKIKAAGGIYLVARSIDDLEARRAEILGVM